MWGLLAQLVRAPFCKDRLNYMYLSCTVSGTSHGSVQAASQVYRRIYSCARMRNPRSYAVHAHAHQGRAQFKCGCTRAAQVRMHSRPLPVTPSTTVCSSTATPAWPKYPDDYSRWLPRLGQYKRPRVYLQKAVCSGLASCNISLNYLLWSLVNCMLVLYV
jgi:hypothetical protein